MKCGERNVANEIAAFKKVQMVMTLALCYKENALILLRFWAVSGYFNPAPLLAKGAKKTPGMRSIRASSIRSKIPV